MVSPTVNEIPLHDSHAFVICANRQVMHVHEVMRRLFCSRCGPRERFYWNLRHPSQRSPIMQPQKYMTKPAACVSSPPAAL